MTALIDDALVHSWLAARSLARGLPLPVADRGGFRVDTGAETEIQRWVFAQPGEGLCQLARGITQPGYLIKLCGPAERLRPLLPPGWQVQASGYMMAGPRAVGQAVPRCPDGYTVDVRHSGAVSHVRILSASGELAASGYGAETADAFVYDRIATAEGHRRLGLGTLVMHTLRGCKKRRTATPELLVATEAGCALYRTLGWRILSEYATGSLPSARAED